MTYPEALGQEMHVSYERGVQIAMLRMALEDIARRSADRASRATAKAALERVPHAYPLDGKGAA